LQFYLLEYKTVQTKAKLDLLINKTIELPISFVVGSSFILGSILGSFLFIEKNKG